MRTVDINSLNFSPLMISIWFLFTYMFGRQTVATDEQMIFRSKKNIFSFPQDKLSDVNNPYLNFIVQMFEQLEPQK